MSSKGEGSVGRGIETLLVVSEPWSEAAEAYRTLRVNLRLGNPEGRLRTLVFTSISEEGGASVVAANLAVTAAQAGSRVLLVDGDPRHPTLDAIFELPNDVGFTTVVLDDRAERIATPPTPIDGLRVLPSGPLPPNPGWLLTPGRIERVLAALCEDADLVVLVSPPATTYADTLTLAACADGVVLVVTRDRTDRGAALRAKEQLERVSARIIGVVLTNAPARPGRQS